MDERDAGGYSVAYMRDEIAFPIYVTAALAVGFVAAAFITGQTVWLIFGIAAAAFTYVNIPLLETGRPTLGANQYGIFIQGLGLIRWRAVALLDLLPTAERAMTLHELQITLAVPTGSALVADWRKRPWYRALMRLPWSAAANNVIRVDLDPFDQPPDQIHRTLLRMWRYYRS